MFYVTSHFREKERRVLLYLRDLRDCFACLCLRVFLGYRLPPANAIPLSEISVEPSDRELFSFSRRIDMTVYNLFFHAASA